MINLILKLNRKLNFNSIKQQSAPTGYNIAGGEYAAGADATQQELNLRLVLIQLLLLLVYQLVKSRKRQWICRNLKKMVMFLRLVIKIKFVNMEMLR